MELSETLRNEVNGLLGALCDARVPPHVRDKVRLGFRIEGTKVLLFEERPVFLPPHEWSELPIAKFTYDGAQNEWKLYCQFQDSRWHAYKPLPAAPSFEELLNEVDADPTAIFWG